MKLGQLLIHTRESDGRGGTTTAKAIEHSRGRVGSNGHRFRSAAGRGAADEAMPMDLGGVMPIAKAGDGVR
jgi:hypothetical protein